MLEYNEDGSLKLKDTAIINVKTFSKYVYLKEKSGGNIYTTNQKRVKHLVSILKKKPDVPLAWKYTEDLLQYVSSNKELFFKWMSEDRGKNIFDKYVNFNK